MSVCDTTKCHCVLSVAQEDQLVCEQLEKFGVRVVTPGVGSPRFHLSFTMT